MQKELAQRIPLVTRGWRQLADAALAELRVSNSMAWCLIYLDRLGPEARQIDLAQAIGITQPSTVRVLDQLELGGLVEREQHPDDKRSNRLALTAAGKALLGKIDARLTELRDELFAGIPDADIANMLRVIDSVSARIAERRG
ncbi:MarR family transcriptional regulator [Sphingomonas sp. DBB INV C78]|uniref:MarR family transcriptional regulator n=1 Tax=Sphingomonas sp. DBB INV C78 TaxID=3349434 RepID=UPI0036D40FDA